MAKDMATIEEAVAGRGKALDMAARCFAARDVPSSPRDTVEVFRHDLRVAALQYTRAWDEREGVLACEREKRAGAFDLSKVRAKILRALDTHVGEVPMPRGVSPLVDALLVVLENEMADLRVRAHAAETVMPGPQVHALMPPEGPAGPPKFEYRVPFVVHKTLRWDGFHRAWVRVPPPSEVRAWILARLGVVVGTLVLDRGDDTPTQYLLMTRDGFLEVERQGAEVGAMLAAFDEEFFIEYQRRFMDEARARAGLVFKKGGAL